MMVTVTFKGFNTPEQAKAFIEWYEGQGEQDSSNWFEAGDVLERADVDTKSTFPLNVKDGNIDVMLRVN